MIQKESTAATFEAGLWFCGVEREEMLTESKPDKGHLASVWKSSLWFAEKGLRFRGGACGRSRCQSQLLQQESSDGLVGFQVLHEEKVSSFKEFKGGVRDLLLDGIQIFSGDCAVVFSSKQLHGHFELR